LTHLQFRCQWVNVRTETSATPFTRGCEPGQVLRIPISHGEGRYYADEETLAMLNRDGQVVFRYSTADGRATAEANPNGSLENIAGICNKERNVLGMMPHPERCCEQLLGGTDGRFIFESIIQSAKVLVH